MRMGADIKIKDRITGASEIKNQNKWVIKQILNSDNHLKTNIMLDSTFFSDEVEIILNDYEIEVRDGKTFAVKKKPKYPTTYEECCDVLKIPKEERDNIPSFEEWKKKHQQKEKKQELKIVEPLEKEEKKLTFEDIAGMEDVKEKLKDVIDQFNNPERYEYLVEAIMNHLKLNEIDLNLTEETLDGILNHSYDFLPSL